MTYQPANPDDTRYNSAQLQPLMGGRYTDIFRGPPETDIGDLHTEIAQDPEEQVVVSSGWMPNEEHLAMLDAGAHVRVSMWAYPIPPLAVVIEPPVCGCHDEPMHWVGEDGYQCAKMMTLGDPIPEGLTPLDQAKREFTEVPEDEPETGVQG